MIRAFLIQECMRNKVKLRERWCGQADKPTKAVYKILKAKGRKIQHHYYRTEKVPSLQGRMRMPNWFKSSSWIWLEEKPLILFQSRQWLVTATRNRVPNYISSRIDEPLMVADLEQAVCSMSKSTSQELDGLPLEFYQQFWKHTALVYLEWLRKHL